MTSSPIRSPAGPRPPSSPDTGSARRGASGIWLFAAGYFAAYAPYTALTKAVSKGALPFVPRELGGLEILPVSTLASLVGMLVFLTATRWWRHATHHTVFGISLPSPTLPTLLSGLATAAIIATTTLSYTFTGTSILLMMLLMRGGVLVIAPIVDLASKRKVRPRAWLALALSLAALLVALGDGDNYVLTLPAVADVVVYLAGYFIRLRLMSKQAKTDDPAVAKRFFVEEQMVATPAIVGFLALLALVGGSPALLEIRAGFSSLGSVEALLTTIGIGILSQGTGIFGALVLLDGRENAFCVPVNRASSVLAGIVASFLLAWTLGMAPVPTAERAGAALLVGAIIVLAWPTAGPSARAAKR